jgi:CrcB protein
MTAILLVGTGGFLGSILRFWLSGWVFRVLGKPWFPVGTLAVNVIGCYFIGFLGGVAGQRRIFNQELRLFLFVGVLGGFTTFSAFAYETSSMLRDSRLYGAWLNVSLQIVLGLLAVRLGVLSSRGF